LNLELRNSRVGCPFQMVLEKSLYWPDRDTAPKDWRPPRRIEGRDEGLGGRQSLAAGVRRDFFRSRDVKGLPLNRELRNSRVGCPFQMALEKSLYWPDRDAAPKDWRPPRRIEGRDEGLGGRQSLAAGVRRDFFRSRDVKGLSLNLKLRNSRVGCRFQMVLKGSLYRPDRDAAPKDWRPPGRIEGRDEGLGGRQSLAAGVRRDFFRSRDIKGLPLNLELSRNSRVGCRYQMVLKVPLYRPDRDAAPKDWRPPRRIEGRDEGLGGRQSLAAGVRRDFFRRIHSGSPEFQMKNLK
jgi:hypothetical protein